MFAVVNERIVKSLNPGGSPAIVPVTFIPGTPPDILSLISPLGKLSRFPVNPVFPDKINSQ